MNWDAIGRLWTGKNYELVLIEAKANIAEIGSDCKAVPGSPGWKQIRHAFQQVITDIGVTSTPDKWMHGYYQAANRMAVLWFLRRQGVPARLLCIYFTGDLVRPGAICPSSWGDWAAPLGRQDAHLGVAGVRHHVLDRVHKLPLSVMRI
jgi:hypothetical protein